MTSTGGKIILLEFNELCPRLLDHWMAEGRLPHFKAFYDSSRVFTAEADETDHDHLEPWIQWYSLHTGLSFSQHGVFHLTDGPSAPFRDLWRLLADGGCSVASCASMNVKGFRSPGSFYLPDPWCGSEDPYPTELRAYQDLIRSRVQENSNGDAAPPNKKACAELALFLARRGLRAGTVMAILGQVLSEAVRGGDASWRRVPLLDRLQFDIFRHYWRRHRFDFSTFFLNSTAHYQHAYWHLAFPDSFPDLGRCPGGDPKREAILFGYKQMDRMLGAFRELERDGAMLVLTTALSQQPNPEAGHCFYRARDIISLLTRLGVRPTRILPVMSHQYSAHFATPADAERGKAALAKLKLNGRSVLACVPSPEGTVFFDNGLRREVGKDEVLTILGEEPETMPFFEVFYKIDHTKSGIHHPDSVLWFKTGNHKVHQGKVSILDILPTFLDYYGVPVPPEGAHARTGRSLMQSLGIAPYRAGRANKSMEELMVAGTVPDA